MSNINTNSIRLYGGMPSGDIQVQQAAGPSNANVSETLAVGTVRRLAAGPKINSRFSLHVFVDSAGGATSAMTVWYSNHPNPSLATDNDWVQDTVIGTIDLTVTGGKFINVGNVDTEYIMVKAVVATSTANVRVFYRAEGLTHGKIG